MKRERERKRGERERKEKKERERDDGIFMKVFLNHVRKWCGSYGGVCARSS